MEIKYSTHHNWYKDISQPVLENFSKKQRKRISKTLLLLSENHISISMHEIDEVFLNQFLPFYREIIEGKKNPRVMDIRSRLDSNGNKYKQYGLLIKEKDVCIGGTVVMNKKNTCTTAFKAYKHNWLTANLEVGPSLISEYFVTTHALNSNYTKLSHGRDNNPYGQYSSIGLCAYKLSMGYHPVLPKEYEVLTLNTDNVLEPLLVLERPENGQAITLAHFFHDTETLNLYGKVTKYPDQLLVTLHNLEE